MEQGNRTSTARRWLAARAGCGTTSPTRSGIPNRSRRTVTRGRPVQIEILYFAAARERAGQGHEVFDLAAGADVRTLVTAVVARHPALEPLLPFLRIAVNEAFEDDHARPLAAGDTVAFIPPVSGGAPLVALTEAPVDPRAVEALVAGPDRGAILTFVGTVRDHTGPHGVVRLEYEAYASMALKALEAIRLEAVERWPGVRVALHHRLGIVDVGEASVVIAAAAAHRADAFEACRHVIERLKQDVPIFKREVRADGSVWVGLGS
ncbi:MAG: molybdenum cofactor biosynthesis protein MoaE [Myxococcales bacterium]|nr:molybdenum cofactor biosynthesis protein MoaE [Myxococcales bacterium]